MYTIVIDDKEYPTSEAVGELLRAVSEERDELEAENKRLEAVVIPAGDAQIVLEDLQGHGHHALGLALADLEKS